MTETPEFSHIRGNRPSMVDVGEKAVSRREATAEAIIVLDEGTIALLRDGGLVSKKGPVFDTAVIAGTLAVKQTHHLIPFCHPLLVEDVQVHIGITADNEVHIRCTVRISGKTGVEMEALTGATVAALTIYDMCKSASRHMVIRDIRVLSKSGGRHDFDHTTA